MSDKTEFNEAGKMPANIETLNRLSLDVLKRLNQVENLAGMIGDIQELIKTATGFAVVAIRLETADDFPYYQDPGRAGCQQKICRDEHGHPILECTCGLVITGNVPLAHPFFTKAGSFWANDTAPLLALNPAQDPRHRPRNRCIHEGYQSIALIPLRSGNRIIGLLQFNDRRKNRFTLDLIEFFEGLSVSIGIALDRIHTDQKLLTARDNLETQIRERTAALRKLSLAVEQSPNLVVITDINANIEYVNEKFTETTGYTRLEVIGKNPRILQSGKTQPEEYEKLWECLNAGREWRGTFYNRKKNGEYFIEAAYIAPLKNEKGEVTHYVANKEDITEKVEMQKKLSQNEKLAAIGELSSSIAHELNNPIGIVLGYADFLNNRLKDGDPKIAEQLTMIRDQALRCKTIVGNLLDYAKRREFDLQAIDINDVVDSSLIMVQPEIDRHGVRVETHLEPGLPPVRSNYPQLQQVFINLCTNACQAMAANTRSRTLALITYQIGTYAYLSIADTGLGMDEETLRKIFTPFFTTKEKGTGLGLAICSRIVEAMAGSIEVTSHVGLGTEFIVKLQIHE